MVHPLSIVRRHRLDFSSFASLDNELTSRAVGGLVAQLYARGSEGTAARKIGSFEYDSALGATILTGVLQLDRVTDSQYGIVASGSGSTRTMESGHNLALSGVGTCYDISAGAHLATTVEWTRVGDVVTFTAGDPSASFSAGDVLYTEGLCEFGEALSAAGGGFWVPQGFPLVWNSGLQSLATADAGNARLRFGAGPSTNTPPMLTVYGELACGTMTADGSGGYWALGSYSPSSDESYGVGFVDAATVWNRALVYGSLGAPVVSARSVCGDPSSVTDIHASIYTARSSSANTIANNVNLHAAGLTDGLGSGGTGTTATTYNQGADGPPSEVSIKCKGFTGALDVTLKGMRRDFA